MTDANGRPSISRRVFVYAIALAGVSVTAKMSVARALASASPNDAADASNDGLMEDRIVDENSMVIQAKIRRALLSGPDSVTKDATVAEIDSQGQLTVLRPGTNRWVCIPGNENIIGAADMCADPAGLQWMMDVMARKPKPSNTVPGLIYMLNGAVQHSYTDPFDRTSPPIPIGPHWMLLWPFDAKEAGLPTVMRDAGTLVMFAGTPYAHLHICGSPWDGYEFRPGDRGAWTMTYARP